MMIDKKSLRIIILKEIVYRLKLKETNESIDSDAAGIIAAEAAQSIAEKEALEAGYDNIDDYASSKHGYTLLEPIGAGDIPMSPGEQFITDIKNNL